MDTLLAFVLGEANRGREERVFDWIKAAKTIKKRKPATAMAGLAEDWGWTGDTIWDDGRPVAAEDAHTYLASTWATPVLVIDGKEIPCFRMQTKVPDWCAHTFWPNEALAILKEGE